MILAAFETLYDREPAAWVRKLEAAALMGVFCEAFDVRGPELEDLPADRALAVFRSFSAACMGAALVDPAFAAARRAALRKGAYELGVKVRKTLRVRRSNAFRAIRFFYRGIGIELEGTVPGKLRFGPCSFAGAYTPGECALMAGFDEGFICGIAGIERGELTFTCRLTEGAQRCDAQLVAGM